MCTEKKSQVGNEPQTPQHLELRGNRYGHESSERAGGEQRVCGVLEAERVKGIQKEAWSLASNKRKTDLPTDCGSNKSQHTTT